MSATGPGLAVVAKYCGFPHVLAFLALVAILVVFTVAASTAWFAPELADAVEALGARHGSVVTVGVVTVSWSALS